MAGFIHGIRTLEIGGDAPFGWPALAVDLVPPKILSLAIGAVDEGDAYSILLAADEPATFERRAGADGALFDLDGATLLLPPQSDIPLDGKRVCRLRATDAAGNVTDFDHGVLIVASVNAGTLDFSDPANSGLVTLL